jgi:hypothetical protein
LNGQVAIFPMTTVQSVPIAIKVASSNPADGKVYSIKHYGYGV